MPEKKTSGDTGASKKSGGIGKPENRDHTDATKRGGNTGNKGSGGKKKD